MNEVPLYREGFVAVFRKPNMENLSPLVFCYYSKRLLGR